MTKVKVFGAGSIGNHLSHACRQRQWAVTIVDSDPEALRRTQEDIYPSRYGEWDDGIELINADKPDPQKYDLVIVGTPPDSHISVGQMALEQHRPRVMLIEKPLSPPTEDAIRDLVQLASLAERQKCRLLVGYNHLLTAHTKAMVEKIKAGHIGAPITISTRTREHWGGIFKAHPWLDGPKDSYLGFSERGGGALCEHSHALSLWLYVAQVAGMGQVDSVQAVMDWVADEGTSYDRLATLSLRTDKAYVGEVIQDVVTKPTEKSVRIQGKNGALLWQVNARPDADALTAFDADGQGEIQYFEKTRPDDFKGEIEHIEEVLASPQIESPLDFSHGQETMLLIHAAFISHRTGRAVHIDRAQGLTLEALRAAD